MLSTACLINVYMTFQFNISQNTKQLKTVILTILGMCVSVHIQT